MKHCSTFETHTLQWSLFAWGICPLSYAQAHVVCLWAWFCAQVFARVRVSCCIRQQNTISKAVKLMLKCPEAHPDWFCFELIHVNLPAVFYAMNKLIDCGLFIHFIYLYPLRPNPINLNTCHDFIYISRMSQCQVASIHIFMLLGRFLFFSSYFHHLLLLTDIRFP